MQAVMNKIEIQKYSAYKNSGVEWLGEIPEHWEILKLKQIADFVNRGTTPNYVEHSNYKVINQATFSKGYFDFKNVKFTKEKSNELSNLNKGRVENKDILLASTGGGVLGKVAYFEIDDDNYFADSHVTIIRGNAPYFFSKFYYYILSINYDQINGVLAQGSANQTELQRGWLLDLLFPVPSFSEQTFIANFLDRKTALIDKAISIKEKQIELFKERRQILIHKAVTRGLNPNVKMKDSGVEWIGEIPEGWEVKRLKYCLIGKLKYGGNESGIEYDFNLPRYVRITDFGQDGKLNEDSKLSLSWKKGREYLLKDGDILFARSGATVGKTYQFRKSMSIEANYSLVVANKYLTGFDQPKLTAMYVDKKLQDVIAVQALSRLNRSADKLGKKTEDLFILDFYNSTEEIKKSFDPFYTATSLSKATDINVLHELKASLDETGIYEWAEVEDFVDKYFKNVNAEELSPIIDVAAARFNSGLELDDKHKADYKIKAKQFVKIYGQMASIMPYEIAAWEKLFWFLKFLVPKLIIVDKDKDSLDELLNSVDLSTYGLERVKLNASIGLDASETEVDPQNPNPRGAHDGGTEEDELDLIIKSFNERWFQGWDATPEEQRVRFVNLAQSIRKHPDFKEKYEENTDTQNRDIAFRKIFEEVMGKQRKNELDLYRLMSKDEAFKQAMLDTIKRMLAA